jgi:HPt (histidine-containing phosphotransfer) domain-containing protein
MAGVTLNCGNTPGLLDRKTTLERLGDDEELFGEVAQILIQTAPEQLNTLGAALAANDMKRAYEEAHSLKGAVAAFEAPEVLAQVAAVERHARAEDAAAAGAAFTAAQPLVERLLEELAAFVPAA